MDWLPAIKDWRATPHTEIGLQIDDIALREKHPYATYVTAGTIQHEETSAVAINDIFRFINDCFM